MNVSYADPLDDEILWYSPHTLVLGMADEEDRKSMSDFFRQHHADIFDVYRDPSRLIPKLLDYPCFLRVIDYETYQLIEPALIEHIRGEDPETLTVTVVYGAARDDLIDSVAILNASTTHPTVLAGYYSFLIRNR